MGQLTLQGVTPEKLRLGLVLAIFSSVGFESATSLGSEARNPLVSIPRAVKWSAILAGVFFFLCAYAEVLGFRGEAQSLGQSSAPLHVLVQQIGLPPIVGTLTDLGAVVTFFSCFLACITAAARVLFLMGRHGALHSVLGEAHEENQTPHRAVLLSSIAAFLPAAVMTLRGMNLFEIYGLIGTLATFGFVTAYILVCAAAPLYLRSQGRLTPQAIGISVLAILAMSAALLGNLYPVPDAPVLVPALPLCGSAPDRLRMVHDLERAVTFVRRPDIPGDLSALPNETATDRRNAAYEFTRSRTWNGPPHQAAGFSERRGCRDWRALVGIEIRGRSALAPRQPRPTIRPRSPACAVCIPAPLPPLTPCAITPSGTTPTNRPTRASATIW